MKKLTRFLLPILVASFATLSGCKNNNKEDNKILLTFGDIHAEHVTEVNYEKLKVLKDNKENFLLTVSSNTCSCWSLFRPVIEKYIKDNQLVCYHISYDDIKDFASQFELNDISKSTTTFAIYENGSLKHSLKSNENENIMEDSASFNSYMNEKVMLPSCYFINESDLDQIKSENKTAVVYFERSNCTDCSSINSGILRDYILENKPTEKIFVLDCQAYYKNKTDPNFQTYQDKKDELGLSTKNNPVFGYNTGVFPYFSLLKGNEYLTGAVIYNDTITKVGETYSISDSYYTFERFPDGATSEYFYAPEILKGKTLTKNEVNDSGEYISWKHECADAYYKNILKKFLDKTLQYTTFLK